MSKDEKNKKGYSELIILLSSPKKKKKKKKKDNDKEEGVVKPTMITGTY